MHNCTKWSSFHLRLRHARYAGKDEYRACAKGAHRCPVALALDAPDAPPHGCDPLVDIAHGRPLSLELLSLHS